MSKPNIEITIPANVSELKLLTADKYCDANIVVKKELGFRAVTGTFTPTADVTEIHLPNVPSNAQIVEIVPTGTPSKYTTKRAPVTFFTSAKTLNKGEFAPPYNAWAEYDWYGLSRSEALADFTNGFSVSWSDVEGMDILVFEKDMTYQWTAYCWDD